MIAVQNRPVLSLPLSEYYRAVDKLMKAFQRDTALAASRFAETTLCSCATWLDQPPAHVPGKAQALRTSVRWAAQQLAPELPEVPFGGFRSPTDKSWTQPAWRHFNLLRHLVIEPYDARRTPELILTPSTLMARMNIASRQELRTGLKAAVRALADVLRDELRTQSHCGSLGVAAVEQISSEVLDVFGYTDLLGLLSVFRTPVSEHFILEAAAQHHILNAREKLAQCIDLELAVPAGREGQLLMPRKVRQRVYEKLPAELCRELHQCAQTFYADGDDVIEAIWHTLNRGAPLDAARMILNNDELLLMDERCVRGVAELIAAFDRRELPDVDWFDLQEYRALATYRLGNTNKSLALTRKTLKSAKSPRQKARALMWIGVVSRTLNEDAALSILDDALEILPPDDLDRWQILLHQTTVKLERSITDGVAPVLDKILSDTSTASNNVRAYAHMNMASYYQLEKDFAAAFEHAQQSLAQWTALKDRYQVANIHNLLGMLHHQLGRPDEADRCLEIADNSLTELGCDFGLVSNSILKGRIAFARGEYQAAISHLEETVGLASRLDIPGMLIKAQEFLARAYLKLEKHRLAGFHLLAAYVAAVKDQIREMIDPLLTLQQNTPELQKMELSAPIQPNELAALILAVEDGLVTRQLLIEETCIPESTAKVALARLCERQLLVKQGAGKRTVYLPYGLDSAAPEAAAPGVTRATRAVEIMALDLAATGEAVTIRSLLQRTNVSRATASRVLSRLASLGLLTRSGGGRSATYVAGKTRGE